MGPVFLFVDNRWAIDTALGRTPPRRCDTVARAVRDLVVEVTKTRRLHVYWTPGHTGVEGNELADVAAKCGASGISKGSVNIQTKPPDPPTGSPERPLLKRKPCEDCEGVIPRIKTMQTRTRLAPKKSRPRPQARRKYNTRARQRESTTKTVEQRHKPHAKTADTLNTKSPVDQGSPKL